MHFFTGSSSSDVYRDPKHRPETPLLDHQPQRPARAEPGSAAASCRELREYLIYSVGQSGGHFGAGLGVVELTVALHHVFDTPDDRIVWDVGHQAYPHKILTGRREQLPKIRSAEGPAAFPLRTESEYDTFGVGHSVPDQCRLGWPVSQRATEQKRCRDW